MRQFLQPARRRYIAFEHNGVVIGRSTVAVRCGTGTATHDTEHNAAVTKHGNVVAGCGRGACRFVNQHDVAATARGSSASGWRSEAELRVNEEMRCPSGAIACTAAPLWDASAGMDKVNANVTMVDVIVMVNVVVVVNVIVVVNVVMLMNAGVVVDVVAVVDVVMNM